MLALSTGCAPPDLPLHRAVARLRGFGLRALALHRPPEPGEAAEVAALAGRFGLRFVAVFGDRTGGVPTPLLVVEGGPAGEDREASLDALCRRLHAVRNVAVALRTPPDAGHHPAPEEMALVHEAVRSAGYWHDADRGGPEFLAAGQRWLRGASFHPFGGTDLRGLRDALPAGAPAVVACPAGAPRADVAEAILCAAGIFGPG